MMLNYNEISLPSFEFQLQLSWSLLWWRPYNSSSRAPLTSSVHHQQVGTLFTTDRLFHHLAPTHILDARITIATDQLPNRVHPTGSETKYHVFNNQITDNVDIYHSEATTLIPKACTMKYTQNIRAHTVTTHIQPQNPEIIYEHLPYCSYQPYSFKCDKYISMVT